MNCGGGTCTPQEKTLSGTFYVDYTYSSVRDCLKDQDLTWQSFQNPKGNPIFKDGSTPNPNGGNPFACYYPGQYSSLLFNKCKSVSSDVMPGIEDIVQSLLAWDSGEPFTAEDAADLGRQVCFDGTIKRQKDLYFQTHNFCPRLPMQYSYSYFDLAQFQTLSDGILNTSTYNCCTRPNQDQYDPSCPMYLCLESPLCQPVLWNLTQSILDLGAGRERWLSFSNNEVKLIDELSGSHASTIDQALFVSQYDRLQFNQTPLQTFFPRLNTFPLSIVNGVAQGFQNSNSFWKSISPNASVFQIRNESSLFLQSVSASFSTSDPIQITIENPSLAPGESSNVTVTGLVFKKEQYVLSNTAIFHTRRFNEEGACSEYPTQSSAFNNISGYNLTQFGEAGPDPNNASWTQYLGKNPWDFAAPLPLCYGDDVQLDYTQIPFTETNPLNGSVYWNSSSVNSTTVITRTCKNQSYQVQIQDVCNFDCECHTTGGASSSPSALLGAACNGNSFGNCACPGCIVTGDWGRGGKYLDCARSNENTRCACYDNKFGDWCWAWGDRIHSFANADGGGGGAPNGKCSPTFSYWYTLSHSRTCETNKPNLIGVYFYDNTSWGSFSSLRADYPVIGGVAVGRHFPFDNVGNYNTDSEIAIFPLTTDLYFT